MSGLHHASLSPFSHFDDVIVHVRLLDSVRDTASHKTLWGIVRVKLGGGLVSVHA